MIVPLFLVSELCPFDLYEGKIVIHHTTVTVIFIFMKLYRNVYQLKTTCVHFWLLSVSSFPSNAPLFFYDYFCNLYICTIHSSLTVHDISIQFYKKVYVLGKDDVLRPRMVILPFLASKLYPLINVFPKIHAHSITQ